MIIILIGVLFLLIGFSQIGPAILFVLPMTVLILVAAVTFFAMLGGVEGSGWIFLASAGIIATAFLLLDLWSRR